MATFKTGHKFYNNTYLFSIMGFSEGLAPIKTGRGWRYIDKTGKVVINQQFYGAGSFSEGLAPVRTGDKWGYIDKTGAYVINPQFNGAGDFSEGLAPVSKSCSPWAYIHKPCKIGVNSWRIYWDKATWGPNSGRSADWGYIDKTGAYVINPQFDGAGSFSEGLAPVKIGDKWGYIDKTGVVLGSAVSVHRKKRFPII